MIILMLAIYNSYVIFMFKNFFVIKIIKFIMMLIMIIIINILIITVIIITKKNFKHNKNNICYIKIILKYIYWHRK
jgi:hypothetical protein